MCSTMSFSLKTVELRRKSASPDTSSSLRQDFTTPRPPNNTLSDRLSKDSSRVTSPVNSRGIGSTFYLCGIFALRGLTVLLSFPCIVSTSIDETV